jgi:endoglucanase
MLARQVVPQSALFTAGDQPPPPPPPPPATTIVANADTYVAGRDFADINYGANTDLRVKASTDSEYVKETYIRFDLSSVDTINSATLSLAGQLNNSENVNVGIYSSTDTPDWDQSTLTWNTKFFADANPLTTITVNSTSKKTYTADLTSYLQAEKAAGRDSVTLILRATAVTSSYASFQSTESGNGPKLLIS